MNVLLTSAGRRSYLVNYFKMSIDGRGLVHASNSAQCPSFYAADRHVISPLIYSDDYIPFLLDYCTREHIDLLVPLFDIDIPVLSAHKREFIEQGTIPVVPDYEIAQICNDKWKTFSYLASKGFYVPKTFLDLDEAIDSVRSGNVTFPLIVKPRWGMASIGVYIARSLEQLETFYRLSLEQIMESYLKYESNEDFYNSVIIQEYIEGDEYGLDVISDLSCKYRTTSVKRKLSMRAGETDDAVTVDSPAMVELGRHLGDAIPHPGNLDVDILFSDNTPYILELNARFGGGYPFSHAAGVDLPKALVEWAAGKEVDDESLQFTPGVYSYKNLEIVTPDTAVL